MENLDKAAWRNCTVVDYQRLVIVLQIFYPCNLVTLLCYLDINFENIGSVILVVG